MSRANRALTIRLEDVQVRLAARHSMQRKVALHCKYHSFISLTLYHPVEKPDQTEQ